MIKLKLPYKDELAKSFLTVALLFCIFTFYGQVSNANTGKQPTQTEQLMSQNTKLFSKTISYKRAFLLKHVSSSSFYHQQEWLAFIFAVNRNVKVRQDYLHYLFVTTKSYSFFLVSHKSDWIAAEYPVFS